MDRQDSKIAMAVQTKKIIPPDRSLKKGYHQQIASHLSSYNFLFICMITLIVQASNLLAQTYGLEFERISIEQGLSQSTIFSIIQDRQGFLWFGTQDGLNRYDGYTFTVFKNRTDDSTSIADNWINALHEDHMGNIWIGTFEGGLNKFDPVSQSFTTYRQKSEDENVQGHNRVHVVYTDRDSNLWVGSEGAGLSRFNPRSGTFTNYQHRSDDFSSISDNDVRAILEDRQGNLWIGTEKGGLSVLPKNAKQQGNFRHYQHRPADPYSLSSNKILSLFVDSKGKLWIGTDQGLNLYDPINNQFWRFRHNPRDYASLSNDFVYTIFEDINQVLWIGTDKGLNFYDQGRDKFSHAMHVTGNPNSLSNDMVRTIFKDHSGTIWVGTYGAGLNQFDWRRKKFRHYKKVVGDQSSITDNNVWSLLMSRSGDLWIGTNKGLNVVNHNKRSSKVYHHNPFDPNSLSDDVVRVILEDSRGDLWFGTTNGGLNKFDPLKRKFRRYMKSSQDSSNGISDNTIRALMEDKAGGLWIGTWAGLDFLDIQKDSISHYVNNPDDPGTISDDRIRSLYEDQNGMIWIGTYNGLNRFNPKTGQFKCYKNNPEDSTSLSHDRILALHGGMEGLIWIATYGGGLNAFNPLTESFTVFTEKDGLPNNTIYGILEDERGNLWLSTNKGISRFNPLMKTFTNYDVTDGLQSDEFNGGAYAMGQKGEMFFGGINGYNSFFPDKIIENSYIPPVVFTSFRVFDNEVKLDTAVSYKQQILLNYTDNFFSFEFASLDYSNPEKNQYVYKLEGFDQDWVRSGNRRYAKYTNLDGGDYVFRVKGSNSDGVWNVGGASLKISITPPFWGTWWFRILFTILILSVVYSAYAYRVRKIENQKKFLEDQIAERTWEINERNKQLIASKKDTDNILHNVEEGIFLLNRKMEIASHYSTALERILENKKLARKNFVALLENAVTHKTHTSISEFLEFMFRDDVDEESLVNLNPMSQIKIAFQCIDTQKTKAKHLAFKFKRIPNEKGSTQELIATVNDVTDQIRLARELEESQETGKKQIEWMLSILHIEPQLLREFMEGATEELNYMDKVLRHGEAETDPRKVLDKMFRSMHMIKGNAALVDLKFFIEKAHEFEENITHIQEKESITGTDFVPLVLMLREMRSILVELDRLVERISKIHMNFRPKRSYEKQLFNTSLQNLVNTLSYDVNKKIELITDEFDAGIIPYHFRLLTRQILIQLLRNSVYHGIESEEERKLAGKNPTGTITIVSMMSENAFGFRLIDDGRGLQIDKLRAKALKSRHWSASDIESWDDHLIAQTIFSAGISTLDSANLIAGRGVGLDLVKDKVNEAGGQIAVNFERDKYCEFIITVPVKDELQFEVLTDESIAV